MRLSKPLERPVGLVCRRGNRRSATFTPWLPSLKQSRPRCGADGDPECAITSRMETMRYMPMSGSALILVLLTIACGNANERTAAAEIAAGQTGQPTEATAPATPVDYFHDALIANGDDEQTAFGGDLSVLGLNPRDLLQDDPKHAYDLTYDKVRQLEDAAERLEMMRTLFNRGDAGAESRPSTRDRR
jgi:hypothetical protein